MDLIDRFHARWWPLVAAAATALTVLWLMLFTWSAIVASHPAYLMTLIVVGIVAIGWGIWAVRSTAPVRTSRRTWLSRTGLVVGTILLISIVVYPRPLTADPVAVDALTDDGSVDVSVSSSRIRMDPAVDARPVGLVFYPGAKVDPRAYARILRPLAEYGYTVVILKVPFGIAFFDRNGAADVVGRDDGIDEWIIAGHSLGGTVAAGFSNRNDRREIAGLLLWASFPAGSLAARTDLDVMSISGGNDGLATPVKIEASRSDLPPDTDFIEIEGALHAYFGDYGAQDGDGTAGVSRDVAQAQIIQATLVQLRRVEDA